MTADLKRPGSPEHSNNVADAKKVKVDTPVLDSRDRGIAFIKKEYLIDSTPVVQFDDDSAETTGQRDGDDKGRKGKGRKRGQNKNREIKQTREEVRLCPSLIHPEDGKVCSFGADKCRYVHNLDEYLATKEQDIEGICPVFNVLGYCPVGVKCRFLHSHYNKETKTLAADLEKYEEVKKTNHELNHASNEGKISLLKKTFEFKKATEVNKILDTIQEHARNLDEQKRQNKQAGEIQEESDKAREVREAYNEYIESRFYASEKKRLDLVGKKILSPLTTVGNLPYRRLMKTLGADITYSEMAFSLPLIQGNKGEWALPKAHASEYPGFGVQITASKHWQGAKAAEAIASLCPNVSSIDLNSGCPIDLLYRQGCGAAMMEQPPKLVRVLNAMNYCSGDIPTTVKIRMGIKDNHPTAQNLVKKLLRETQTAAITLHGRSRQQRYTKEANWDYIAETGKVLRETEAELEEDKDRRDFQRVNFVGNGDCFNWEDFTSAVENPYIDSVMVGRGALIKPWLFEEVEARQYLDKSATERLEIVKQYAQFAMEHWGTDEYGLASARRYMCEFLSFFYRYTPYGVLERFPIKLNERPQNWRGRNELETLLGSGDYKDWIKITEMFLGPAGENFNFTPKHKSNSYE